MRHEREGNLINVNVDKGKQVWKGTGRTHRVGEKYTAKEFDEVFVNVGAAYYRQLFNFLIFNLFVFTATAIGSFSRSSSVSFRRYFWLPLTLCIVGNILYLCPLYIIGKMFTDLIEVHSTLEDLKRLTWVHRKFSLSRNRSISGMKLAACTSALLIAGFAITVLISTVLMPFH